MSISSTGLYGSATIVNSDLFNDVEALKEEMVTLSTSYLTTTQEHCDDISQNRLDISQNRLDISQNKLDIRMCVCVCVCVCMCITIVWSISKTTSSVSALSRTLFPRSIAESFRFVRKSKLDITFFIPPMPV
jgi:hypothetical protein